MLKTTILLGMVSFITLSGCAVNHRNYESTPVRVQTSKGEVLCQLYSVYYVKWDEAIRVPANMNIVTGNDIFRNEGQRLRQIHLHGS